MLDERRLYFLERGLRLGPAMQSVDHERIAPEAELVEVFGEVEHFPQCERRRSRDHYVCEVPAAKGVRDPRRALPEPAEQVVQVDDETGHLVQESATGELANSSEHDGHALGDQVEAQAPRL